MDTGLRVATVDYGGWDTHQYQEDEFSDLVGRNEPQFDGVLQ